MYSVYYMKGGASWNPRVLLHRGFIVIIWPSHGRSHSGRYISTVSVPKELGWRLSRPVPMIRLMYSINLHRAEHNQSSIWRRSFETKAAHPSVALPSLLPSRHQRLEQEIQPFLLPHSATPYSLRLCACSRARWRWTTSTITRSRV